MDTTLLGILDMLVIFLLLLLLGMFLLRRLK